MEEILKYNSIMLYGCGGGYDIYGGIPLYWELLRHGKNVILGNYSFADDIYKYSNGHQYAKINGNELRTEKNKDYFPGADLAKFLKVTIYTMRLLSINDVYKGLVEICAENKIDCIIGIDAGHDAALFGDEIHYGSPLEDSITVLALRELTLKHNIKTYLACISTPTEDMDFSLFINHIKSIQNVNQWIPNNSDDTINFEKLLDTTPLNTRSVPNESLLAAMKNSYDNKHLINDRLFQRSIAENWDNNDYPPVIQETKIYYIMDIMNLISASPFYQKMINKHKLEMSIREYDYLIHEILKNMI